MLFAVREILRHKEKTAALSLVFRDLERSLKDNKSEDKRNFLRMKSFDEVYIKELKFVVVHSTKQVFSEFSYNRNGIDVFIHWQTGIKPHFLDEESYMRIFEEIEKKDIINFISDQQAIKKRVFLHMDGSCGSLSLLGFLHFLELVKKWYGIYGNIDPLNSDTHNVSCARAIYQDMFFDVAQKATKLTQVYEAYQGYQRSM